MITVCIAGATGWVGRDLVRAVASASDLRLVGAVARSAAGQDIGTAIGGDPIGVLVAENVADALVTEADVLIDYTKPGAVKRHALTAIGVGVNVVVGTSGLSAADYAEIDAAACKARVGVIASGNFSLTAALMQRFALMAAGQISDVEVIEYCGAGKSDAPSGTARELAEKLGATRKSESSAVPLDKMHGYREARGAAIETVQVHSVRLPGFISSCEALFGLPDERLTVRHDSGSSAGPYVAGTLLAARKVVGRVGLTRGLDTLMFGEAQ